MQDPAHKETDREIELLEKRLKAAYRKASKSIANKLKNFLAKYEQNLKEKRESLSSGEITKRQFSEWAQSQISTQTWYINLIRTLSKDALDADIRAASIINGALPKTYAINFNFGTYQIEKAGRVNTAFTLYDQLTVAKLLKDNPALYGTAKVNEAKDLLWNQRKLSSALAQGILQGEPVNKVANRVQGVVDMNYKSALRTARTTMTGAQNAGRVGSYERAQKLGIKGKKRWLATLDNRTRDSHALLDGVSVDINERFANGLEYPGDETGDPSEYMNCRCTLIYEMEGTDYDNMQRSSKLGDMSYEEWKAEHQKSADRKRNSEQRH